MAKNIKTDDAGLSVSLALDDPTTGDRGILREVIADNQWHKYQWFLDRPEDWEPWVGGGNGQIDGVNVSFDSIQFFGAADAQIFLDDVFWDPQAAFQSRFAGDFNGDGTVDAADFTLWRDSLGAIGSSLAADADDNGTVDQGDFSIWKAAFGQSLAGGGPAQAASFIVPEPSSWWLLASVSGVLCAGRFATVLQKLRHG